MIIVDENNVSFLVLLRDSLSELGVEGDVLLVCRALVEHLGLGSVGHSIVQTWPQNLVTELVVRTGELSVADPYRHTLPLAAQTLGDGIPGLRGDVVRLRAESPNPEFAPHAVRDAVDSISKTSIARRASFKVPVIRGRWQIVAWTAARDRSGFSALEAGSANLVGLVLAGRAREGSEKTVVTLRFDGI